MREILWIVKMTNSSICKSLAEETIQYESRSGGREPIHNILEQD